MLIHMYTFYVNDEFCYSYIFSKLLRINKEREAAAKPVA